MRVSHDKSILRLLGLVSLILYQSKKCGHRIHVLFMMYDVYWYCGHVDIEEFRWGRKGERHTTCNIVWNMERDQSFWTYTHRRMGHGFRFLLPPLSVNESISWQEYSAAIRSSISYTVSVEKMWTQNTCIIHDVWRLLILSNEKKTNDYENFEKGMIYN
jgi:hypothetical protein